MHIPWMDQNRPRCVHVICAGMLGWMPWTYCTYMDPVSTPPSADFNVCKNDKRKNCAQPSNFKNLLFCREYFYKSYFNTSIIWSTEGVITIKFRAKSNLNSGRLTFSVSFFFEEGEKIFRIWVSIILDFCQKLKHFSFGFISNKIGASV